MHLQKPTPDALAAYGITPSFTDFIRSLNYNIFRDAADHGASAGGDSAKVSPELNPWQVTHALLVVRAVAEVNELRYVLCPRYMTDAEFWGIYFTLSKQHLPASAIDWREGDPLPPVAGISNTNEEFMSFSGIGNQLRSLTTKLQSSATAAAANLPAGVELTTLLPGRDVPFNSERDDNCGSESSNAYGGTKGKSAEVSKSRSGTLLSVDPDLEAYLQAASPGEEEEGGENGGYDTDTAEGEDEVDLAGMDEYLNELDAVEPEEDEDALDVEEVLKELQDGDG
jgi:hypothetical protein